MPVERFGTALNFTNTTSIESYGDGTYAVSEQFEDTISLVTNGVKTLVATGTGAGQSTQMEVLSDGAFLLFDGAGFGTTRIINEDGTARTGFFSATPDDFTPGIAVTALADGGFAVGGASYRFETDNNPNDDVTIGFPQDPGGSTSARVDRDLDAIFRFFDADGDGGNTYFASTGTRSYYGATAPDTVGNQAVWYNGGVAALANGTVVEGFNDAILVGRPVSEGGGYIGQGIVSVRFVRPDGTVSGNIQVNTELPTNNEDDPSRLNNFGYYPNNGAGPVQVVSLGEDGFAVIWSEFTISGNDADNFVYTGRDTKIRYFDLNGNALTGEVTLFHRAPEYANLDTTVSFDTLGDGRIAILWQDGFYRPNDQSGGELNVTVVGAQGSSVDTTLITAPRVSGRSYFDLDLANLGNGQIAVSINSGEGFRVETFNVGNVIDGHAYGETLNGGIGPDLIRGFGGDDVLNGNNGGDRIEGGTGNDTLNGGLGRDALDGGAGSDAATYANATAGVVASLANASVNTGEAAGDTYTSIERLIGSAFNDALSGTNVTNNTLRGGAGNDTLKGYTGNDALEGGAGNDTYVFNTALNAATNVDTILDFKNLANDNDRFLLDDAFFAGISGDPANGGRILSGYFKNLAVAAQDPNDRIVYNQGTGELFYDSNLNQPGGQTLFAKVTAGTVLTYQDFFVN